jgi:hypothetical protein
LKTLEFAFRNEYFTLILFRLLAMMAHSGSGLGTPTAMRPLLEADSSEVDNISGNIDHGTEIQVMTSDNKPNLGELYVKCRAEKEKSLTMNVTAATCTGTGEKSYATMIAPTARIGSFETPGDSDVYKIFRGTRVSKGGGQT